MKTLLFSGSLGLRWPKPSSYGRAVATLSSHDPAVVTPSNERSHHMPTAVHSAFTEHISLSTGGPLVVSVSAGVDSVALFRVLLALTSRWRWRLHVLHFNHNLRPESAQEEVFVRELAAQHEAPFHVRRLPAGWADIQSSGIQERSRDWRREESLRLLAELQDDGAAGSGAACRGVDDFVDSSEAEGGGGEEDGGAGSDREWGDGARRGASVGAIALGHHADDQVDVKPGCGR